MLKITGLWKNISKAGVEYLAGNLGNVRIFVFPNTQKTKSDQPDFEICFGERVAKAEEPETQIEETPPPF